MLLCYVIDSGLSTSLLLLATLIIMFYITLHYIPIGRFQSGGTCRIAAAKARWWCSWDELEAIWPKSRRRLLVTRWESGEQVVPLTSAFDTWRVYGILKILRSAACQMHRSEMILCGDMGHHKITAVSPEIYDWQKWDACASLGAVVAKLDLTKF